MDRVISLPIHPSIEVIPQQEARTLHQFSTNNLNLATHSDITGRDIPTLAAEQFPELPF
jgi:hypothetical protein